jgi:hypothetical protein
MQLFDYCLTVHDEVGIIQYCWFVTAFADVTAVTCTIGPFAVDGSSADYLAFGRILSFKIPGSDRDCCRTFEGESIYPRFIIVLLSGLIDLIV